MVHENLDRTFLFLKKIHVGRLSDYNKKNFNIYHLSQIAIPFYYYFKKSEITGENQEETQLCCH